MLKRISFTLFFFFTLSVYAQQKMTIDTIFESKPLTPVVFSFNKWEQNSNEVPHKIAKINKSQIYFNNPQTSADMMAQTGLVFIQKSQAGGGSPMIRGFATNRILMVLDGVRLNNAIYRSGNIQNIISIDALSLESTEVIFGAGSLIYGSDAIGGVMDFHTLEPKFAKDKNQLVKASVFTRYASANKEKTIHADINIASKKWSFLSAFTYSSFDDTRMGIHGGDSSYSRKEYVSRINNTDSIFINPNPKIQRFSGYNQLNFLQKIRFKPSAYSDLQYSFIHANTGSAPRYDRLIQYRQGKLRFAEWNYGPMLLNMHQLQWAYTKKYILFNESRMTAAYQDYEESRIERTRNNNNRLTQAEKVRAININWDAIKRLRIGELFYGVEYVFNKVGSYGNTENIITGIRQPYVSRYPDGSKWSTAGIYGSYKVNVIPVLTITTGLRYSYNTLNSTFDTSFIKYPFTDVSINAGGLTGNAGVVYRPGSTWQLNAMIATGYRMPNVDDMGKVFESAPGIISVPNPSLKPEYAWNIEIGIVKEIPEKMKIELIGFYTFLDNAIVQRPFTFNGNDSIFWDGNRYKVQALQNVAKANVWGVQASFSYQFTNTLQLLSNANFIKGKETDDTKNEQVPLRHAPPFYGNTAIKYQHKKIMAELNCVYNSTITNNNLAPSEQAKTDIYAKDENGKPYAPGWYVLHLKTSYKWNQFLMMTISWENITNQRYRPYSSGIVSPGSNFMASIRWGI